MDERDNGAPLHEEPAGKERRWSTGARTIASVVAVLGIYAIHSFGVLLLIVGLEDGTGGPPFQCWGRWEGYRQEYCGGVWGWWSIPMYLPEITLLVAAAAALYTGSFRTWKYGLGAAAVSLIVFWVFGLATHEFAVNQMPFIPPWRY